MVMVIRYYFHASHMNVLWIFERHYVDPEWYSMAPRATIMVNPRGKKCGYTQYSVGNFDSVWSHQWELQVPKVEVR